MASRRSRRSETEVVLDCAGSMRPRRAGRARIRPVGAQRVQAAAVVLRGRRGWGRRGESGELGHAGIVVQNLADDLRRGAAQAQLITSHGVPGGVRHQHGGGQQRDGDGRRLRGTPGPAHSAAAPGPVIVQSSFWRGSRGVGGAWTAISGSGLRPPAQPVRDRFGAVLRAQFPEDVRDVRFDRALGDHEPTGDQTVGPPCREQFHNLDLACACSASSPTWESSTSPNADWSSPIPPPGLR